MNTSEFQSLCVTNRVSALKTALPTLQELYWYKNQPVELQHLTSSVPVPMAICVTQRKLYSPLPHPTPNTNFLVPATNQLVSQAWFYGLALSSNSTSSTNPFTLYP